MSWNVVDVVVTNPELRRQALSIASTYIDKKMATSKLRQAGGGPKK